MNDLQSSLEKIVQSMSSAPYTDYAIPALSSSPYGLSKYLKDTSNFDVPAVFNATETSVQVRILLPLINRESVKVTLEDSVKLSVDAEYYDIVADKTVSYSRSNNIPSRYAVDRQGTVTASYTDGVLTIDIPLVPKNILEITLDSK